MRRTTASILDCRHMHESGHKSQAPHVSPREPQVGGGIVLSHVHETHSASARWFPAVFVESAWLHAGDTFFQEMLAIREGNAKSLRACPYFLGRTISDWVMILLHRYFDKLLVPMFGDEFPTLFIALLKIGGIREDNLHDLGALFLDFNLGV
jgi:hypothetical protein